MAALTTDDPGGGGGNTQAPGPPTPGGDKNRNDGSPTPGGDKNRSDGSLYSDRVKVTIARSERLKRNVLEINLDSDSEASRLDKNMMAQLFKTMGVNKSELEGYQLLGKRKLFVWFPNGVDLTKYCRDECFRVAPGVKTALIKPMDNTEVVVTIKGININTPDTLLFSYLSHFGKLVSQKVVYDTEKDGPLEGLKNGDRKYKMDFTGGRGVGTFHIVDGANVMVSYSGQRKTCGRCNEDARTCPGGGWARSCDSKGGKRIELQDHMKKLWSEVGFNPESFDIDTATIDSAELDVDNFTPPPRGVLDETDKAKFCGINIRNLPRDISETDLLTILENRGLPTGQGKVSLHKYKRSAGADIENLSAEVCSLIIETINEKFIEDLDRRIYCSGISELTSPTKLPPNSTESAPVLNITSNSLETPSIPGLSESDLRKTLKPATRKSKAGKNPESKVKEPDTSDSDTDSDLDSSNSKTTKKKIKMYQNMVLKEKQMNDNHNKAKRNHDQVSPKDQVRRQKPKDGGQISK